MADLDGLGHWAEACGAVEAAADAKAMQGGGSAGSKRALTEATEPRHQGKSVMILSDSEEED